MKELKSPLGSASALGIFCALVGCAVLRADIAPQPAAPSSQPAATSSQPAAPSSHLTKAMQNQDQEEEKEGNEEAADIAKSAKFSKDKALSERISRIGAAIAAVANSTKVPAGFGHSDVYPFKYTYHIIDDKTINAFSLPGGHIYIYKGLLDHLTTDDEIAGILGHETAHAAHHHVSLLEHEASKMNSQLMLAEIAAIIARVPPEDVANLGEGANLAEQARLNNHFSEMAEEDADHTGMVYMQKAGFNPVGMLAAMQQLKETEDLSPDVEMGFLMDHPLTSQRLVAIRKELSDLDVRVDAKSLRRATGSMIASEVDVSGPGRAAAATLKVGDNTILEAAPVDKSQVVDAAAKLNQLMDANLQLYEVKASGVTVVARDQTLIAFNAGDLKALTPQAFADEPTPEAMATNAAKALRTMLWEQTVDTVNENEIEVAPTPMNGQ